MKFSARVISAGVLGLVVVSGTTSQAGQTADFQDDFNPTTPAAGWSYRWNASSAIGTPPYTLLVPDNGRYDTLANNTYPDAAPANLLAIGSEPVDPTKFPANPPPNPFDPSSNIPVPLPQTYARPGQGTTQDSGGIERAAIVAYTFSAADIAQYGNHAYLTDYYFAVAVTSGADGMTARVFHDTDPTPIIEYTFPGGFAFQTSLDPRPIDLGTFSAGQSLYFALGSAGTDAGDEMRLDFTISLTPEPSSAAVLLVGGVSTGLLHRRRRA